MMVFASNNPEVGLVILPSTTLSGYAYWVFAWRWMPPKNEGPD